MIKPTTVRKFEVMLHDYKQKELKIIEQDKNLKNKHSKAVGSIKYRSF